ncbi:sigma-70 family RNA polymerase sigma factor [Candidatus Poribacteria bacterium]|nr:sigma-70 family RNA polymerase sigma factor [Candidatus Poribacteria bacterium]
MRRTESAEEKKREFEEIAIQYMDSLYSAALRMTRDGNEAEDLVQDAYLRAYRFFDKFEKGTNFKAWLFKILKNIYINKYRKRSKMPQMVEVSDVEVVGELSDTYTPENEIFDKLLDDDLTSAIEDLPEEFRFAIILSDVEGLSYKEIANVLDIPIGTVMSRLHRGRKLLRESLKDYAEKRGFAKDQ